MVNEKKSSNTQSNGEISKNSQMDAYGSVIDSIPCSEQNFDKITDSMQVLQEQMEEATAPLKALEKQMEETTAGSISNSLNSLASAYSIDPVGVTEREFSNFINFPEYPTVEVKDIDFQSDETIFDVAEEQRDLTKEIHYSMMQVAELTKRIVDMNEIAANSAEETTSLTKLIYILTGASIVIGLAGLGINTATAIIPAESSALPLVVISIWAGAFIVTISLSLIMIFCLPKRKKNSKTESPKSP